MRIIPRKLFYLLTPLIALAALFILVDARSANNARTNAMLIVNDPYLETVLEADFQETALNVADKFNEILAPYGGRIVDVNAFKSSVFGDALEDIDQAFSTRIVSFYLKTFTRRELADIAAFNLTETGKIYLERNADLELVDGVIQHPIDPATGLANVSDGNLNNLQAFFLTRGGRALERTKSKRLLFVILLIPEIVSMAEEAVRERITVELIVEIVKQEGLVTFSDPSNREKFVQDLLQENGSL
jgi:hypothetical protein